MPNYKEGLNRHQQLLFPPSMDEYVDEDNSVRAIDSYVDSIDLAALGIFTCNSGSECQPAYHPALLLKIYLYGYLNSIRSSRKLERELKRNVEMMWLCTSPSLTKSIIILNCSRSDSFFPDLFSEKIFLQPTILS